MHILKVTTNNVDWRPLVVIIICCRVPKTSVSSPSPKVISRICVRGKQSAVNMKDKPNSTRIYDEDGFRRRAACICVRKDSDEVIIIILYICLSCVLFENIECRVCIAVRFFFYSITRLNPVSNCVAILYCCSSQAITPRFNRFAKIVVYVCVVCVCAYSFFLRLSLHRKGIIFF